MGCLGPNHDPEALARWLTCLLDRLAKRRENGTVYEHTSAMTQRSVPHVALTDCSIWATRRFKLVANAPMGPQSDHSSSYGNSLLTFENTQPIIM